MSWAEVKKIIKDLTDVINAQITGGYVVFTDTTAPISYTVPNGVSSILVSGYGGGGSGGSTWNFSPQGAGGGGGGAYIQDASIPVTPGDVLTITVGAGGAAATYNAKGNDGGDTTLAKGNDVLLTLGGGKAGAGPGVGTGGNGGTVTFSGNYSFKYAGGNGQKGSYNANSGGGTGTGGGAGGSANTNTYYGFGICGGDGNGGAYGGGCSQSTGGNGMLLIRYGGLKLQDIITDMGWGGE